MQTLLSRRRFLKRSSTGLGAAAVATLFRDDLLAMGAGAPAEAVGGLPGLPHFAPKAKRVIYLFQGGAPSQHELWDYKPKLADLYGTDLPDSVRQGQRLTPMTASQAGFPIVPSKFKFARHGESGAWISELMPHTAKVADELCFIKTMHTEAINHDPGMTFLQTGNPLAGRPSVGAWLSYGLGSMNQDLPTFVVMVSSRGGNQVYDRLWGNGFLPSEYQGVKFLSTGDPVLYLSNPGGVDRSARRRFLDALGQAQPAGPGGVRRPGDGHAHRPVRDGLPHAGLGAGAHRPVGRAGVDLRALRARFEDARDVRGQLPAGPAAWRSATCASSSSSTGVGTCTPSSRGASRPRPRTSTSRRRR